MSIVPSPERLRDVAASLRDGSPSLAATEAEHLLELVADYFENPRTVHEHEGHTVTITRQYLVEITTAEGNHWGQFGTHATPAAAITAAEGVIDNMLA